MRQRSENRIQHNIKLLAHIFGEESPHKIAMFLQQRILTTVSPVGVCV